MRRSPPRSSLRRHRRQGVLILVVLSLLVLFTMIAVTFVSTSGQAKVAARIAAKQNQVGNDPREQLDAAVLELLRGTRNPLSALRQSGNPQRSADRSLLADLYGSFTVEDSGTELDAPIRVQLFVPGVPSGTPINPRVGTTKGQFLQISYDPSLQLPHAKAAYEGRVLTFLDGPAQGISMRIVHHESHASSDFRVLAPPDWSMSLWPRVGDTFLINGRPFAGDPEDGNESYDAADEHNLHLAAVIPPAQPNGPTRVIPSFDRSQSGLDETFHALIGTNGREKGPAFFPVDNDGDSVLDSVWLDLGFPVQTHDDGRLYRPLVAFLCTDLDGRLNLNAHGDPIDIDPATRMDPMTRSVTLSTNPLVTTARLPRGQGVGPAEIDLRDLFDTDGEYLELFDLRYGRDRAPGFLGRVHEQAKLGLRGQPFRIGPFAQPPERSSYFSPLDYRGRYAFGPDIQGFLRYEIRSMAQQREAVDAPYETDLSLRASHGERWGGSAAGDDTPFTLYELERLLRPYDRDAAALPDRLARLVAFSQATGNGNAPDSAEVRRRLVTTASYDLPVPGGESLFERVLDKMVVNGVPLDMVSALIRPPARPDGTDRGLLSAELSMGLRMDLNRLFGNGYDDDNNGTVDDGGESSSERLWEHVQHASFGAGSGIPLDRDGNGQIDQLLDVTRAKQLYARSLYLILMAVQQQNAGIDFDGDPNNDSPQETARGFAQWAINVVDFRDADAIMTPFEYDPNPFSNGWQPDGNVSSQTAEETDADRQIVWGCERPELLITETFAYHDRRTEDLDDELPEPSTDNAATTTDPDPQKQDVDFDQREPPRSGFFLELYNPRRPFDLADPNVNDRLTRSHEHLPGELYTTTLANDGMLQPALQLDRLSGQPGDPRKSPVWRMLVVKPSGSAKQHFRDPDHWSAAERPQTAALERVVYFVNLNNAVNGANVVPPTPQTRYSTNLNVAPLPLGGYAVIGPKGDGTGTGLFRSYLSDHNPPEQVTSTQRIELRPGVVGSTAVRVRNNFGPIQQSLVSGSTVAVVINQPDTLNFSVSEPVTGDPLAYPTTGGMTDPTTGFPIYDPPLDIPLDDERANADEDFAALMVDGTTENYRTVHLQRLANPLLSWNPLPDDPNHSPNTPVNPYRTVDSMTVDLVAYNGIHDEAAIDDPDVDDGHVRFQTVERGDANDNPGSYNVWRQEPATQAATAADDTPQNSTLQVFDYRLEHTLGWLNEPLAGTASSPDNEPPRPFPHLVWNNRPFISHAELVQVPWLRSSQLLRYFSREQRPGNTPAGGLVGSGSANAVLQPPPPGPWGDQFMHLINFFAVGGTGNPVDEIEPFRELLEYVRVPSPYTGTDNLLSPQVFSLLSPNTPTHFNSPFNRVSRYRDPGRVNVNTIYHPTIWNAVQHNFVDKFQDPVHHPGPSWPELVQARRGYGSANANLLEKHSSRRVSFFAGVFRSLAVHEGEQNIATGYARQRTLTNGEKIPLFAASNQTVIGNDLPDYDGTVTNMLDVERSSLFRYAPWQRLANLLTTRSNVYAVWVSIGYFEAYPGGQLKAVYELRGPPGAKALVKRSEVVNHYEIGDDTGEAKRHRAFYIIDRSIPVAFEPGVNHNVENCIVVRSYIE